MSRKTKRIDDSIEAALWDAQIETTTLIDKDIGDGTQGTMRALSESAGKCVVEALIGQMREEEIWIPMEEYACARKAWAPGANAYTREWLEDEVPASHWDALVRAIRGAHQERDDRGLTMSRLVDLARMGPKLARKMQRCDPWVAREACWKIPMEFLDGDEQMWKTRAVQLQAKELGCNRHVSDEDAERALERWADWLPTSQPPLALVAAEAGHLFGMNTDRTEADNAQDFPSSAMCHLCHEVNEELELDDTEWTCRSCGTHHDREENAAKNIEAERLRLLGPWWIPSMWNSDGRK